MKVTVLKQKEEPKRLTVDDVPVGYVFEILESGSNPVKALKLENEQAVLLMYSSGREWFEMLDGESWINSSVNILGKLTEIVVDPNEQA